MRPTSFSAFVFALLSACGGSGTPSSTTDAAVGSDAATYNTIECGSETCGAGTYCIRRTDGDLEGTCNTVPSDCAALTENQALCDCLLGYAELSPTCSPDDMGWTCNGYNVDGPTTVTCGLR